MALRLWAQVQLSSAFCEGLDLNSGLHACVASTELSFQWGCFLTAEDLDTFTRLASASLEVFFKKESCVYGALLLTCVDAFVRRCVYVCGDQKWTLCIFLNHILLLFTETMSSTEPKTKRLALDPPIPTS